MGYEGRYPPRVKEDTGDSSTGSYYGKYKTEPRIENRRLALQAVTGVEEEALALQLIGIEGKTVLFVGCGPGYYEHLVTERYKPANALGIDTEEGSIAEAAANFHSETLTFRVQDATQPLPGPSDVTLEQFVLIQVPDAEAQYIVDNMVAATKPGGKVVLIEYVEYSQPTESPVELPKPDDLLDGMTLLKNWREEYAKRPASAVAG